MRSNDGFERFGEIEEFALDLKLIPDPDDDESAPAASVGSWGQWRVWVGGVNLCEFDLEVDSGEIVRCDAVTWYLAPLVGWLAANWNPLLHEERLPGSGRETARAAYLVALTQLGDDPRRFEPWQDWASRHSLRWAAEGGLVPDVFLRRLGDDVEFSWGRRMQPGGEAVHFHLEPGSCRAPVLKVAQALDGALRWFQDQPSLSRWPWFAAVAERIEARTAAPSRVARLPWALDAGPEPGPLTRLYNSLRARFAALTDMADDRLCIAALSPAAAMFGAVTPNFSPEAAVALLTVAADSRARAGGAGKFAVDDFAQPEPLSGGARVWMQGYELAQDFIEDADVLADADDQLDLDALFKRLGITVRNENLGKDGPRGVALAGADLAPTVVVNPDHPMNAKAASRRFTLAHELCHILFDRNRARRVTHVSTPWAPAAVEQRANAFAAMLLMPPELVRRLTPDLTEAVELDAVAAAADKLGVGLRALIQHLMNMGEISDDCRDRLMGEIEERAYPSLQHAPTL